MTENSRGRIIAELSLWEAGELFLFLSEVGEAEIDSKEFVDKYSVDSKHFLTASFWIFCVVSE